jgi:hypothetical protein
MPLPTALSLSSTRNRALFVSVTLCRQSAYAPTALIQYAGNRRSKSIRGGQSVSVFSREPNPFPRPTRLPEEA